MSTAVYDEVNYDDNAYKDDDKLFVQFFMEAVLNKGESDKQGRPIFDQKPMVRIITPGSKDVMVNKATEQYQRRFQKRWDRFMAGQGEALEGTPIEQVPFLTVSQVAEFKALNVFTLEALAGMADTVAHRFMGFQDVRAKAQRFLEAAKSSAPLTALHAENEALKSQIEVMQRQLAELMAAQKSANEAKKQG